MSESTARAELGRRPIHPDAPAGRPPQGDDPALEAILEEVRRDPVSGQLPDWGRVLELGTTLLESGYKDFTVASYVCVALTHLEGLVGLRDGLAIVLGLTQDHWEAAQPPLARIRKRQVALELLTQRCAGSVSALAPHEALREPLRDCAQLCADLMKLTSERFQVQESPVAKLVVVLRQLQERLGPEPVKQAPPANRPTATSATAEPTRTSTTSPPAGGGPATASSVEIAARSDVPLLLLKCATYLRGKDPQDPLAYRLPRLARWAEIDAAPPEQRGRIALKGPGRELADALRGLARTQSWQALLEAVEDAFWQHPLWLDLQQHASQALNGRGFQAAALGVRDDLRSLLERAPTLLDLAFSDGTALADAETRSWIEAEVRAGGASAAASRPAGPALDVEGFETIQKEARGLAARGDVPGALARMQQALPGDASPRARFLLRLDLASLCADVGRDRLALGIVAELDEQMKRHELETWEPELCIRALQLAYRCHQRALPEDAEAQSRALVDSVYQRLCRLNPMVAAALG